MKVLGIGCYYHDSSAALIDNGAIKATEEERFTRKKHDISFPVNSINYCLKGTDINDIDYIAFYEKPLVKFERVLYQHLDKFPLSLKTFLSSMPGWMKEKLRVMKTIRKMGYKGEVLFIEHHMAHAASSFLMSNFNEAAILTIDGVGEWTTTAYGKGKGNDIELFKEMRFPHSLGLLYSAITAYLGFKANNDEYKIMGLAAYGNKNTYYNKLKRVIDIKEDGSYSIDMSYFTYHYKDRMLSKKLYWLLGGEVRKQGERITKRHKDIASALQTIYEEALFKILNHVYEETECKNLVIAGGCGLNSVANGKIIRNTPFEHIWIQPNSGDGGTSMGCAAYVYCTLLNNKRNELNTAFLGPEFKTDEIKGFLDKNKINYSTVESKKQIARLIYKNNVVGWFQGRMEWGPRALGNRSILANPCNPKMKDILNRKVKHREEFRPFAPVVCEDDANKYFECDMPIQKPAYFMLVVYPVRKEWRKKIPAVTHVDGSGRLQVIKREHNPMYYDLIKEFGKLSGIPMLINTSFNIRGEPIVCSPEDAYKCMMGTGIDYLIMDRFIIRRKDNPKDIWNGDAKD